MVVCMMPNGKEMAVFALFIAVAGYGIITGLVKLGAYVTGHLAWAP